MRLAYLIRQTLAWLTFIANAEATCRTKKPDAYTRFIERLRQDRWQVTGVDGERARLAAFQRHFQVPDFWHWDGAFSPHPYQPCR